MKNRNRILAIIGCIILGCSLFFVIRISKDLKGIRTDWERIFTKKKNFFRERSFSGKVIHKTKNVDPFIPYSLTIKLDSNTIIPPWEESFYHQFNFDSEKKTLLFTISDSIYESVEINSRIIKKEESDSIYINGKAYILLSSKPFEWVSP